MQEGVGYLLARRLTRLPLTMTMPCYLLARRLTRLPLTMAMPCYLLARRLTRLPLTMAMPCYLVHRAEHGLVCLCLFPTAGAINWILKDGLGQVSVICRLFSRCRLVSPRRNQHMLSTQPEG